MPDKCSDDTMVKSERIPPRLRLTAGQARAMRAEHARLAALYASWVEHAQAHARSAAAAHWTYEYRRCTARCRVLGEQIRAKRAESPATGATRESNSLPFAQRRVRDVRTTGEAA
jgi:uncharacterized protein YcbX